MYTVEYTFGGKWYGYKTFAYMYDAKKARNDLKKQIGSEGKTRIVIE